MGFTSEQVAILDANAEVVEAKRLFTIAFASQTFRLVEDVVTRTVGGLVYQPCFGWLRAAPVDRGDLLEAVPAIYHVGAFTATPTDDVEAAYATLVLDALTDEGEWFGAPVTQSLQMYADGAPVGPAISMHRGWLADISPSESVGEAFLTLRSESVFARRNRTPLGAYTDRDQQRRHPGDRGAEFVASLVDKVLSGWLRG
mgnify:CR=1 FL=1